MAISATAGSLPPAGTFPLNPSLPEVAGLNLVAVAIIGTVAVRGAIESLLALRARELAGWQLLGMLPRQVGRVAAGQALMVTLAAAVAGLPGGIVLAKGLLAALAVSVSEPVPQLHLAPGAHLGGIVLLFAVTMAGLRRPLRRIVRIDPAIAVRDVADRDALHMGPVRLILSGLGVVAMSAMVALALVTRQPNGIIAAVLGLVLAMAIVLAAAAPVVVVPTHRAWTALIPDRLTAWWLARAVLQHHPRRIASVSVPLAVAVILAAGMQLLFESARRSQLASFGSATASGASIRDLLLIVLFPTVVALVGGAAGLLLAAQRRDVELALGALVGLTPWGLVRQVAAEVVSVTMTGLLLAVSGLSVVAAVTGAVLSRVYPRVELAVPVWVAGLLALVAAGILLVTALGPVVPMLRRPPQRVLAAPRG